MVDRGEVEQRVPSWAVALRCAFQFQEQQLEVEKQLLSCRIAFLALLWMVEVAQEASHRTASFSQLLERVPPIQLCPGPFDEQSNS